jgi:hypothetical protein
MKALVAVLLLTVPVAARAGWCETQQFEQALHLVPVTACDARGSQQWRHDDLGSDQRGRDHESDPTVARSDTRPLSSFTK